MRVLVTGAAGFIGSTLVDRLLADGHSVVGIDDLSMGRLANLGEARRRAEFDRGIFQFVKQSVTAPDLVVTFERAAPEVVCHLAAQVDVRASVAKPHVDATTNVLGSVNVLEASVASKVRKVVYASSGGTIYGDDAKLPVTERAKIAPGSPYGASKAAVEHYLSAYRALYGIESTTLALANVYGPRQDPHGEAGVVGIFAQALLRGEPTKIYGDGTATRDYLFVDDAVDAFVRACAPVADGRRFNIGTGVETTTRRLHSVVARACNAPDEPQLAPARLGELARNSLDPTAAKAIGWAPWTDLSSGVAQTVSWLKANP